MQSYLRRRETPPQWISKEFKTSLSINMEVRQPVTHNLNRFQLGTNPTGRQVVIHPGRWSTALCQCALLVDHVGSICRY